MDQNDKERREGRAAEDAARSADSSFSDDYSRVVANLTHELKTPLHSILAVASLLSSETDGPLTAEQRKQVDIITRNGEQLLELITELLQFSSTATRSRKINLRRLDPGALFEDVVRSISPVAQKAGVVIEAEMDQLGAQFCSDPTLLHRIVANLLSNAVKFSPHGGKILFFAETMSDGSIRLQIADNGIGMNAQTQAAIFKEFFQAEAADSRRFGGVGLGLALVKSALTLLKGRIEVQSEPNQGSVFTLFFPSSTEVLEKPKIALVESDENVRLSLSECFSSQGYETVILKEHELLAGVAAGRPDLVVLDAGGVQLEGLRLLESLRKTAWGSEIRVIVMSVLDGPEERAAGFKAGASDFIVKPFKLEELLARVRRQIEQPW